jgi:hypothetical protein
MARIPTRSTVLLAGLVGGAAGAAAAARLRRRRRGRKPAPDPSGGTEHPVDELLARASAQDAAGRERAEEHDAVDVRDDPGAVRRRITGDASRATARGEEAADPAQAAEPATGER